MSFVKANRVATWARIGLTGPTNAGKTYTALRLAVGLVVAGFHDEGVEEPTLEQIFSRIAVLDSERGRAKFYANRTDLAMVTGEFLYMELKPPYTPDKYQAAIQEGSEIVGTKGVVITDSLSHVWSYSGGVLQIQESISKQSGKNSYTAWQEGNTIQNKMIDKILDVPCHTISTMRSKMSYVIEQNDKGKMAPKQIGLKPIQRDDVEYEFDITLMLEKETNNAKIVKDTTFLAGTTEDMNLGRITEQIGIDLYDWLNNAADPAVFAEEQRQSYISSIQKLAKEYTQLKQLYKELLFPNTAAKDLTSKEAELVLDEFSEFLKQIKGGQ